MANSTSLFDSSPFDRFIEVPEDAICYQCCPHCGEPIVERQRDRKNPPYSGFYIRCRYSSYECYNGHVILDYDCGGHNQLQKV